MTIHHATIKKAEKLGFVLTQKDGSDEIQGHWTERNKRAFVVNSAAAPGLVDDLATLKMLVLEYPNLKVEQPYAKDGNYVWEISLRGDVIGEGARLAAAWDDASDVLGGGSEKDEDSDEDAETDEDGEQEAEAADGEGDEDEPSEGASVVKRKYKQAYRPFKMTCGDELAQLAAIHLKFRDDDGKMRIDKAKMKKLAIANNVWSPEYEKLNVGMIRMNILNRLRRRIRKENWQVVWA